MDSGGLGVEVGSKGGAEMWLSWLEETARPVYSAPSGVSDPSGRGVRSLVYLDR